ncbi:WASP actin nucleation promoting factor b isoform X1 [Pseudochaenichthys georgianus]|uniref:WASP actin nucleation promoting factor b isoform X1 n=1 Tax=Pseudochaenichthys georgianus TaxID=52239 RepID=UPI00146C4E7A|nr:WASP actin nucleation promoting factor b isoform X1 [Pseudochaenichthys georgianus]
MSRGSKTKPEGARSSLLSQQENEKCEELMGRRCASMATAVAQLFMALPHSPSVWSLQQTGVVCFVKDNHQRSYFIRMFDMKMGRMVWEQEIYNQIVYSSPQPFFHTFEADDCQVGLNFSMQQEAEDFRHAVEDKITQRNTRQVKKQRPPPPSDRGNLPRVPIEKASPGGHGALHMATVDIQNPDIHSSRYRAMPPPAVSLGLKKDKKKGKKGPKLSKADIGAPSGFKHVGHVGWDPNNIDPDMWKLLSQAGISADAMNDEQTSQMVLNVIEQSGGMEAVKREMNRGGPPPPSAWQAGAPPSGPWPRGPGASTCSEPLRRPASCPRTLTPLFSWTWSPTTPPSFIKQRRTSTSSTLTLCSLSLPLTSSLSRPSINPLSQPASSSTIRLTSLHATSSCPIYTQQRGRWRASSSSSTTSTSLFKCPPSSSSSFQCETINTSFCSRRRRRRAPRSFAGSDPTGEEAQKCDRQS